MMVLRQVAGALVILLSCALIGCGGGDDRPRPFGKIDAERRGLPALYLTIDGREVTSSRDKGIVINRGDIAWPAYTCTNPDCPGEKPQLFIWPDPMFSVKEDGSLGDRSFHSAEEWEDAMREMGGHLQPTCPACLPQRNLETESDKQKQQYSDWVQLYVLPKTEERLRELDEERLRRQEYIDHRVGSQ